MRERERERERKLWKKEAGNFEKKRHKFLKKKEEAIREVT